MAHLVQSVSQSHLARDEFLSQVVVLLLQTVAGLLQPTVLLLRVKNNIRSDNGAEALLGDLEKQVADF